MDRSQLYTRIIVIMFYDGVFNKFDLCVQEIFLFLNTLHIACDKNLKT